MDYLYTVLFSRRNLRRRCRFRSWETEKPQTGDISLMTSLLGKIEPSDVVYLYPKASGDVTEVNVKAGDIVNEGDVICRIDTKLVETAKASLDAAVLQLSQAQTALFSNGDSLPGRWSFPRRPMNRPVIR